MLLESRDSEMAFPGTLLIGCRAQSQACDTIFMLLENLNSSTDACRCVWPVQPLQPMVLQSI
jgi:hypothetical protein